MAGYFIVRREPVLASIHSTVEFAWAWARFVTGLVDCAALEPTASREQVRQGPEHAAVQRAIGNRATAALLRAPSKPGEFTLVEDLYPAGTMDAATWKRTVAAAKEAE